MIHRKRRVLYAQSVKYGFNQSLALPAKEAFDWCTDYQPYDLAMMKERGRRFIRKISTDTILLTESMPKKNRTIRKTKLVRLNRPELSWTNTHMSGPNRYSQFLYKIIPEGKTSSRLFFRGLYVCYSGKPIPRKQLERIGREERRADSTAWRHLAAAMRKENAGR
jgi:hypothetical protein